MTRFSFLWGTCEIPVSVEDVTVEVKLSAGYLHVVYSQSCWYTTLFSTFPPNRMFYFSHPQLDFSRLYQVATGPLKIYDDLFRRSNFIKPFIKMTSQMVRDLETYLAASTVHFKNGPDFSSFFFSIIHHFLLSRCSYSQSRWM